ncbi:MAG: hypothetical protein FWH16_01500 [Oscillospiraceae bacterium]|nr:hypothetical protein [Oscillospiraceae bacterium]
MSYVYKTIESDKLSSVFDLPLSLLGKKVEVIIRPLPEKLTAERGSAFGCLKKYADPSLIHEEDGVWERAVAEKYADS